MLECFFSFFQDSSQQKLFETIVSCLLGRNPTWSFGRWLCSTAIQSSYSLWSNYIVYSHINDPIGNMLCSACQLFFLNFLLTDQALNASMFTQNLIVDFSPIKLKTTCMWFSTVPILNLVKHYFKSRNLWK